MKRVLLYQKVEGIKAASQFQHKLIDSIFIIMQMKRKAEFDYKFALQGINRQLQRYIFQENGFLTEIVKSFQSYISVIYQNQVTLIDGYDHEILNFLLKAKQSKMQQELICKVKFFDAKITECQEIIINTKRLINENEGELQIIASEVKLSQKIGELSEDDKNKFGLKFSDMVRLKKMNEASLQQTVDGMMELTMTHNEILKKLDQYQTVYLEQKGSQVFDNFMRAFVIEVSFIKNMQFDVGNILTRVKQRHEEHKKVALDALRTRMKKQDSKIKSFIWDTYKKMTTSHLLEINQRYINPRIKDKWSRVCEYYNQAL